MALLAPGNAHRFLLVSVIVCVAEKRFVACSPSAWVQTGTARRIKCSLAIRVLPCRQALQSALKPSCPY